MVEFARFAPTPAHLTLRARTAPGFDERRPRVSRGSRRPPRARARGRRAARTRVRKVASRSRGARTVVMDSQQPQQPQQGMPSNPFAAPPMYGMPSGGFGAVSAVPQQYQSEGMGVMPMNPALQQAALDLSARNALPLSDQHLLLAQMEALQGQPQHTGAGVDARVSSPSVRARRFDARIPGAARSSRGPRISPSTSAAATAARSPRFACEHPGAARSSTSASSSSRTCARTPTSARTRASIPAATSVSARVTPSRTTTRRSANPATSFCAPRRGASSPPANPRRSPRTSFVISSASPPRRGKRRKRRRCRRR